MKPRLFAVAFGLLLFSLAPQQRSEAQTCIAGINCLSPNCVECAGHFDTGCGCWRYGCEPVYRDAFCGCQYDGISPDCYNSVGFCRYVQCRPWGMSSPTQMTPGTIYSGCTPWPWEPPHRTSRPARLARKISKQGAVLSGT